MVILGNNLALTILRRGIIILRQPKGPFEFVGRSTPNVLWTSSDVLSGCLELAQDLGFDARHYLAKHGIDEAAVMSGRGLLPFDAVSEYLEDVALKENLPDYGFRLGRAQRPLSHGLISQLTSACPNFGEGLRTFVRYQKLYSQSSHWQLIVVDGTALMRRCDIPSAGKAGPQLVLLSLTLACRSMRALAGSTWSPTGVYIDNDALAASEDARRYFATPIFCGSAHNELAFPEQDLLAPIKSSNPEFLKVLMRHFDLLLSGTSREESISGQVYHLIRSMLGDSRCNIERISANMHMHPRMLQRLLLAEGTTFRQLLTDARLELADHLLSLTRTPILEISEVLGYSSASAFTRAFERGRGFPPSKARSGSRARLMISAG